MLPTHSLPRNVQRSALHRIAGFQLLHIGGYNRHVMVKSSLLVREQLHLQILKHIFLALHAFRTPFMGDDTNAKLPIGFHNRCALGSIETAPRRSPSMMASESSVLRRLSSSILSPSWKDCSFRDRAVPQIRIFPFYTLLCFQKCAEAAQYQSDSF